MVTLIVEHLQHASGGTSGDSFSGSWGREQHPSGPDFHISRRPQWKRCTFLKGFLHRQQKKDFQFVREAHGIM